MLEPLSEVEQKQYLTELYDLEPLSELQKKQYLAEIGLEPVLDNYNKEIIKHGQLCFKCREEGLICHKNLELIAKRDRCFKIMREEYQELC